jgi:hypothetical protein
MVAADAYSECLSPRGEMLTHHVERLPPAVRYHRSSIMEPSEATLHSLRCDVLDLCTADYDNNYHQQAVSFDVGFLAHGRLGVRAART